MEEHVKETIGLNQLSHWFLSQMKSRKALDVKQNTDCM